MAQFFNFSKLLPPPNFTKESESSLAISITYLGLVLILPTKLDANISALSVFKDFCPPPK